VFYSQDADEQVETALKNKSNKIVVRQGQIIKISKDKDGNVAREPLTKQWTDWIDYWSVDFNYESKREIIRIHAAHKAPPDPTALDTPRSATASRLTEDPAAAPGGVSRDAVAERAPVEQVEWEEIWTGDYVFENEWQSFRTKKDRSLELTSPFHECAPGRRKIAVKVVDIFGNDTMTIVEVTVGKSK